MKKESLKERFKKHTPNFYKKIRDGDPSLRQRILKAKDEDFYLSEKILKEHFEAQIEKLKEEIKSIKSERTLRKNMAWSIFWFSVVWCVFVILIILSVLFNDKLGDKLAELPLSVLIGSTAVNVFACFQAMAKGIFSDRKK